MVIVDTDVLVSCLKGEEVAKNEVTGLLEAKTGLITPIQQAEVYANTLPEELPAVSSFFNLFECINFDRETAELAGEFMHQYSQFYPDLTIADCLVGAAAAKQEAEIYTHHPQHFPMTEVKLYYKTIDSITKKSKPRKATLGEE